MKKIFLTLAILAGIISSAQVKIGGTVITNIELNPSSLLELESTTQGVLFPRMALTSTTSPSPLAGQEHVAGMVVYNTATTGDVTTGMYANDGTKWVKMGATVSKTLYTDNDAITSARTVTLNNNDLTFTAGVGGTGKTVVASTFKTSGAVYGNVRIESNVLTSAAWLDSDYIVIFTNASLTFSLPSATANPGRIISLNNATGGNKTYVTDATYDHAPKGVSTLTGGKGQILARIGNIWYVIGGY